MEKEIQDGFVNEYQLKLLLISMEIVNRVANEYGVPKEWVLGALQETWDDDLMRNEVPLDPENVPGFSEH